ncbi:MAG: CPBP family intramembrane metalloprotease [Planctomycetes bacterium]|nr:CPBP family intramembrane metalloprotease [Planctomycetota bacterium]
MSESTDAAPSSFPPETHSPSAEFAQVPQSIFLPEDHEPGAPALNVESAPIAGSRNGPGFFESLLWMVGFHIVQVAAVIFACVLLVFSFLTSAGGGPSAESDLMGSVNSLMSYLGPHLIHVFGFAQLSTVLYSMLAVRLRLGRTGLRELGWRLPWKGHVILIVALCVPLSFLCTALQSALFDVFPASRHELEDMLRLFGQAPLSLLILIVGLGPGLGEELLFRGLIGRGLIRRWGLPAGVLCTSVLFGLWHLIPSQPLAVIPLGLAMHFVYCVTRSFWAPVVLHFLNNSLAMVILKYSQHPLVERIGNASEWHPGGNVPLLVASAATVAAILILLWQTRVLYLRPDGTVWDQGFLITAAPPPEVSVVAVHQQPQLLMLAGSAFNSLGFAAGLWRLTDWAGLPW